MTQFGGCSYCGEPLSSPTVIVDDEELHVVCAGQVARSTPNESRRCFDCGAPCPADHTRCMQCYVDAHR